MGMNSCMCVVVRRELVGAGALFSPDPGITFRWSGWVASSLTNAPILHCPQMFSPIFLHLFVTICITFLLSHSSYSSVQSGIIFLYLMISSILDQDQEINQKTNIDSMQYSNKYLFYCLGSQRSPCKWC